MAEELVETATGMQAGPPRTGDLATPGPKVVPPWLEAPGVSPPRIPGGRRWSRAVARRVRGSGLGERLGQVVDVVFRFLDAHREADEAVGDAQRGAGLRR